MNKDLFIQYFTYLYCKGMKNMYIFAANRNENKYINSFTVCSDSDNNSTDKLFNQLIYANSISFSSNA